jgi:hypothetical protein
MFFSILVNVVRPLPFLALFVMHCFVMLIPLILSPLEASALLAATRVS